MELLDLYIPTFKVLSIVYNQETKFIDMTHQDTVILISLQFQYLPSQGFSLIHEVAADRNERTEQFYWRLWYDDDEMLPDIDIPEEFVGREVAEQFCAVVRNQGELFKTAKNDIVQAPIYLTIVTCWKSLSLHP